MFLPDGESRVTDEAGEEGSKEGKRDTETDKRSNKERQEMLERREEG